MDKQYPDINYLQDYGPSQEPIYRRGSRATEMGLRLGVITEEDITDDPPPDPAAEADN